MLANKNKKQLKVSLVPSKECMERLFVGWEDMILHATKWRRPSMESEMAAAGYKTFYK